MILMTTTNNNNTNNTCHHPYFFVGLYKFFLQKGLTPQHLPAKQGRTYFYTFPMSIPYTLL